MGFQAPMGPKFQYSPTYIGSKGKTFQEDNVEPKKTYGTKGDRIGNMLGTWETC